MDLIAFVEARLTDDEAQARAATGGVWMVGPNFGGRDNRVYVTFEAAGIDTAGTCVIAGQVSNMPEFRANAAHIARHDPARVLREVEAKRAILALQDADHDSWFLPLLALPYDDHPDYRSEWAP